MEPFKPFEGLQAPPKRPPPNEEVLKLRDGLKRTVAHLRTIEKELQEARAAQEQQSRTIAILQASLRSAQQQLWHERTLRGQDALQPQQQRQQQWPARRQRDQSPETPGVRVTKASRSSSDTA